MFKSYYVVWKLCFLRVFLSVLDCLNRTMQYGNFLFFILGVFHIFCLNRTMQYGNIKINAKFRLRSITFKSYYVVWKRRSLFCVGIVFCCLNRTMQYGNFPQEQTIDDDRRCLNRTMQYGNIRSFIILSQVSPSLNRTMQYGNYNTNK